MFLGVMRRPVAPLRTRSLNENLINEVRRKEDGAEGSAAAGQHRSSYLPVCFANTLQLYNRNHL